MGKVLKLNSMRILSEEENEIIEKARGEILGVALKGKFEFVLGRGGNRGVRKTEDALKSLGVDLKFKEVKSFQWYPEKWDLFLIAVIQKLFNYSNDDFRQMGRNSAKISLVAKFMMRYFVSIRKVTKEVGKYWAKYRTVGKLEAEEVDEKKKRIVLVLKDFLGYPAYCRFLEGYFWQIASYVISEREDLEVKEIECPFSGGKFHRFKITW